MLAELTDKSNEAVAQTGIAVRTPIHDISELYTVDKHSRMI